MRIGIVGYGSGGKNFHAPFISAAKGLELAGIVARAPATIASAQADFPDVPIYPSLTAMLAAGVDIVTITTPPATRRELVLEAIAAGVAVIADKPFAPDAKTGRELADAAKAKGVVLSVYHNRRFDADIQTLRKVIEQQRVGKLWRLHNRMDLDDPHTLEGGEAGGLLRDIGSHLVDQTLWLLGPVKSVYAHTDIVDHPDGPTNASFVITLTHTSGVHSHISASKLNWLATRELIIYGDKGSYTLTAPMCRHRRFSPVSARPTIWRPGVMKNRSGGACCVPPTAKRRFPPSRGTTMPTMKPLLKPSAAVWSPR